MILRNAANELTQFHDPRGAIVYYADPSAPHWGRDRLRSGQGAMVAAGLRSPSTAGYSMLYVNDVGSMASVLDGT